MSNDQMTKKKYLKSQMSNVKTESKMTNDQ